MCTCAPVPCGIRRHAGLQGRRSVGQAARRGRGAPATAVISPKFLKRILGCRGGAAWDKQHGVGVERRRLLARTREAVARGLLASNLWHSASHAEHARPMLQVGCARTCHVLEAGCHCCPVLRLHWMSMHAVLLCGCARRTCRRAGVQSARGTAYGRAVMLASRAGSG